MRLQLEDQLRALGPAPRRLAPVTPAHRAEALTHAAQRVAAGDVSVCVCYNMCALVTPAHRAEALTHAAQRVAAGDVSVCVCYNMCACVPSSRLHIEQRHSPMQHSVWLQAM